MILKYQILKNLGISYLKRFFRITRGPIFVSIFFTRNCNFDCHYCATSKHQKAKDISLKQWKTIVMQIFNQGCRFITIYGGEPTLRPDLGHLIKYCIDLNMYVHLVTNGSLLNQEMLKEFASYGYFLLGISIDTISDKAFSPKKYRSDLISLLQKIQHDNSNSIEYCIHVLLTKYNINELIPLIKLVNSEIKCKFSLDPVHSASHVDQKYQYRSFCPDLLLKNHQMLWLRNVIQQLKRNNVDIWSPNLYYYKMNKWYQDKFHWKCDSGDLYYAINNDGTVMLCEDVDTPIKFQDFIRMSSKKRLKAVRNYKFDYCHCFKPCYWNPSSFIKHPFTSYISKYRFK
jgi:MoaA/NifB/PqqE/SkfB family radical SAM enzyme